MKSKKGTGYVGTSEPLSGDVRELLAQYVDKFGLNPASRMFGVRPTTVSGAISGTRCHLGTRMVIMAKLAELDAANE